MRTLSPNILENCLIHLDRFDVRLMPPRPPPPSGPPFPSLPNGSPRARPQHVDFYNYESCKSMYKSFATAIITRSNTFNGKRYKDDPTIMAWSIINEPRCVPADARG